MLAKHEQNKPLLDHSLRNRILTAIVLIPLVLSGIFCLPMFSFAIVTAFLFFIAASEWPGIIGKHSSFNVTLFITLLIISMIILFWIAQAFDKDRFLVFLFAILIVCSWLLAFLWIVRYNLTQKTPTQNPYFYGVWGLWILVNCWLGLNVVRELSQGKWLIFYLLVLIWIADSSAYFIGKRWGKSALVKHVSPKKTWEGVYGEFACSLFISFIAAFLFPFDLMQKLTFIVLSLVTVLFSIMGDLLISVFKRQQNLKDTGSLLPGHGGMLDRIDSLTAAVPIYTIGLLLMGLQ